MPKRSNFFQDVVAIIHEHIFSEADVEESASLVNRATGQAREVDVVIRGPVGGYPLVISVEARDILRRADVQWVEQMIGKHQELETDKLILISKSGFTDQARLLAEANHVVPVSPKDMKDDAFAGRIVNRVASLWPKSFELRPESYLVIVERPDGSVGRVPGFKDHTVFTPDGTEIDSLGACVKQVMQARVEDTVRDIDLETRTEDWEGFFSAEMGAIHASVGPAGEGQSVSTFLQRNDIDPVELHRITGVVVSGAATIEIREVPLTHARFGEHMVAYGQTIVTGRSTTIVVTESEAGGQLTMRLAEEATRPPTDITTSAVGQFRRGDSRPARPVEEPPV